MKLFILGALLFFSVGCGVHIKKEPDQVTLEENEKGESEEKRISQPIEVSVVVAIIPERKPSYPHFKQAYTPSGPYVMVSY